MDIYRKQMISDANKIAELRKALRAALDWIDAIPKDVQIPTSMPGFDRDWAESLFHDELLDDVELEETEHGH